VLEGDFLFTARHPELGQVEKQVYVDSDSGSTEVLFGFDYGSISLTSEPTGAAVIANGVPVGRTPLQLPVVAPGSYEYELRKDQYRSTSVSGVLEPGGALNFTASLTYDPKPVTSRSFTNGLGQRMVWIGEVGSVDREAELRSVSVLEQALAGARSRLESAYPLTPIPALSQRFAAARAALEARRGG